jgi:hypothetical protein
VVPPRGMLSAMLATEPPVIKKPGRTQPMRGRDGEEREPGALEVELLLSEDLTSVLQLPVLRDASDTAVSHLESQRHAADST